MKKSNKIAALLFVLIFVLSMLSGCSLGQSPNRQNAEASVSGLLNALKGTNVEEMKKYVVADESMYDSYDEFFKNEVGRFVYQNIDYKILSSRDVDENTVIVSVELSALNATELMTEVLKQAYNKDNTGSSAESEKVLQEIVDSGKVSRRTQNFDFTVKNYGGLWKVDSSDLSKALNNQSSN